VAHGAEYVEKNAKKLRRHRQLFTNYMTIGVYNGKENQHLMEAIGAAMEKVSLLLQLQHLRMRLHEMAEARGSLTDPDVLALSEEADRLIVVLQQLQKNEIGAIATIRKP